MNFGCTSLQGSESNMRKKQENISYITIMLLSVIIGLLLFTWVCRWEEVHICKQHRCATTDQTFQTGPIAGTKVVVQQFIPLYANLKSIMIRINNQDGTASEGKVCITVYDDGGDMSGIPYTIYAMSERPVAELASGNWEEFVLNVELEIGKTYYFSVETIGGGEVIPTLEYRPMALDRIEENQRMLYDGIEVAGASLACGYIYSLPLTKLQVATYMVFCIFLVAFIGNLIYFLLKLGKEKITRE